jgi:hypothetical protein
MKIIHLRFPPDPSPGILVKADGEGFYCTGLRVLKRIEESGTSLSIIPLRQGTPWDASLLVPDESSQHLLNELLNNAPGARVSIFDMPAAPQRIFERPIIIVGAPRSGTTLLFETLAKCANVWTIGGESLDVIERRTEVQDRGNRLDSSDADSETSKRVIGGFLSVVRDREDRLYIERTPAERPSLIRFLEKTPRNSLRIPFLRSIFPDCRFIFLYRDPRTNIGSLIDGWQHDRARGLRWTFLFPPGWRELKEKSIPDIAAAQWRAANQFIVDDLTKIPREHWALIEYEELIADPDKQIRKLCEFAAFEVDGILDTILKHPLPLSQTTLTPPDSEKWRRHQSEIDRVTPTLEAITSQIEKLRHSEPNYREKH